ncbi:MAG TPA: MMPL family transporter [Candidatus Hydrogenedentes bacterium]|nr:MMPL family transporter [Candidatus Hydrogenedentota bacterium]
MLNSLFDSINSLLERHKLFIAASIGILILLSVANLFRLPYDNTIETMLPVDRDIMRDMRFLRESGFSDKLVISFGLKDETHTLEDLLHAAGQFSDRLEPPLVKEVISRISPQNMPQEMASFLHYLPQLLGPEALDAMSKKINPKDVQDRLRFIYRQSLTPGISFSIPYLLTDPLGVSSGIVNNIGKLSMSLGYDVVVKEGHLVSKDSRHTMIIVKTPVILTEGFGARDLVNYLQERIKELPEYVSADIIAGHMHTVGNEDTVKRDIWLITCIATTSFLLLFLFVFRDPVAVGIFLIPVGAILVSISITGFVFDTLSYFVVGMCSVIAGIADDYGIFVYVAVRKKAGGLESVKKVFTPVLLGGLTTIGTFAVFFLSSIPGYRQLAFLSSVSIALCLVFTLFLLPHYLSKAKIVEPGKTMPPPAIPIRSKRYDHFVIALWVLILAAMMIQAKNLHMDNDIARFDGAGPEVFSAEDRFHETWGGKILPAILVVSAGTLEEAYQVNTEIYEAAKQTIGADNFSSLAALWPGMNTRKDNLLRWRNFWSPEKEEEFKKLLLEHGRAFDFSEDAFQPFFEQLHQTQDLTVEPVGLDFFDRLKDQFVVKKQGGYNILSYFPDQADYIAALSAVCSGHPGTFVVSRKHFSSEISNALGSEIVYIAILSVLLTVAFTFILLRDLKMTILAMVPLVTCIVMIAGAIPLSGLKLSMPSILATMVVVGIVTDYGVFIVYYCKNRYETGTYLAVTFAAATTLIGTGALLFAHHPVMFSIGMTLTTGVFAGYLSSLIVIPPLYRCWVNEKDQMV